MHYSLVLIVGLTILSPVMNNRQAGDLSSAPFRSVTTTLPRVPVSWLQWVVSVETQKNLTLLLLQLLFSSLLLLLQKVRKATRRLMNLLAEWLSGSTRHPFVTIAGNCLHKLSSLH